MKKNLIILIAIIALLFSFTSCKDKSDPVENAFAFIEAIENAKNVISTSSSFENQEVSLDLTNYNQYVASPTNLITSTNDAVEDTYYLNVTDVKGTFTETAFSNIKDETGTASRKISGLEITYTYPDEEGNNVEYKVTASAEFVYTSIVERGQTTYSETESKEYKEININGTAYEDLLIKQTYTNTVSSGNSQTYVTIGGKEVSYPLVSNYIY